jgi:hypothetical protein
VSAATARIRHLRDGRDGSAAGTSDPNPALALDRGTRSRYSTGYSIAVLDRGTRRTRRCRLVVHSPPECSQPCRTPPPALQSLRIRDSQRARTSKSKRRLPRRCAVLTVHSGGLPRCRICSTARPSSSTWVRVAPSVSPSAAAQRNPIPPSRERVAGGRRCSAANARGQRGASRNHEKCVSWVPHLRCRLQQHCGCACRFWLHRRERRAVHAHRGCCRLSAPRFAPDWHH